MITSKDVKGIVAAVVTPFKDNEDVDCEGLKTIIRYLVDGGVNAIMPVGGTGEFPHLDREEKKSVIKTISEANLSSKEGYYDAHVASQIRNSCRSRRFYHSLHGYPGF